MRQVLKSLVVVVAAMVLVLVSARPAFATSAYGVVFIHGTGDYPGTMSCSGQNCTVPAAYGGSNYWEAGEVASIANGLPMRSSATTAARALLGRSPGSRAMATRRPAAGVRSRPRPATPTSSQPRSSSSSTPASRAS